MEKSKQTILITDDIEINRALLADMLGSEFEILEAEDGAEAVGILQTRGTDIDLVLLDIVMPKMDGFEVLAVMNRNGWIKDIPVIMISSESSSSYIERAYELGVTEFINRPFDAWIVRRRVMNTLMLSGKQKKLVGLVTDQIYEREKMNNLMITILSHIVEFRNGESGLHVLHIRTIVDLLLRALVLKTDRYHLTQTDISLIATASALHDIGKIGIPDAILNKPGRFTDEEFQIMKTHTTIGYEMLGSLDFINDEKLIQYALEICRSHHERYNGRGYPDGLKGEEIPISAQIVSIADVYDALTSERVYKKAYPHDKALQMILDGECGEFNPLLIDCLLDIAGRLKEELKINSFGQDPYKQMKRVTDEILQHEEELSTSSRTLTLLETERIKNRFYAEISKEVQFEYVYESAVLMLYDFGESKLGLDEIIVNPAEDEKLLAIIGKKGLEAFIAAATATTPSSPDFSIEQAAHINGEQRYLYAECRTLFSSETNTPTSIIGKITDVTKSRAAMHELQRQATHDQLTLLYNGPTGREKITERLTSTSAEYVMLMIDLDYFKTINDTYGHDFGNRVLKTVSSRLVEGLRRNDIIARFGGDEFLVLFEAHKTQDVTVQRIFNLLTEPYNNMPISVSMGVATTEKCGRDFDTLFNSADRAAYEAKRTGKNKFCYFSSELTEEFPAISHIDDVEEKTGPIKLKSERELTDLLAQLRRVFDCLRIFDYARGKRYAVDEKGNFKTEIGDEGYRGGSRSSVSERVLMTKQHASGLVYREKDLYQHFGFCVECAEKTLVLEIYNRLDEDLLGGVLDKAQIIGMIDRMGGKRYADKETVAFNLNYFSEQLESQTDLYAALVVHFRVKEGGKSNELNRIIVNRLIESVRNTDTVVHGEGNRFAILLKRLSGARFQALVSEIRASLEEENVEAGVGAVHAFGKLGELLHEADELADEALKEGKGLLVVNRGKGKKE